jgi:hydroxysqualene dehydroxylase
LGTTLIDPALAYLQQRGAGVRMEHQLRALRFAPERVEALDFGADTVTLSADDAVVLSVPPYIASSLLRDLKVPSEFRAIVNAHFRVEPPAAQPPILGVLNGTVQWLFAFPGRLSVTISAGDRLIDAPREELASKIWGEVASLTGLPAALPPWQVVRERRATFAATPAQDAVRPGAATQWRNLVLAGDWTDTGLPATIEGAIRSGNRAADTVAKQFQQS